MQKLEEIFLERYALYIFGYSSAFVCVYDYFLSPSLEPVTIFINKTCF